MTKQINKELFYSHKRIYYWAIEVAPGLFLVEKESYGKSQFCCHYEPGQPYYTDGLNRDFVCLGKTIKANNAYLFNVAQMEYLDCVLSCDK